MLRAARAIVLIGLSACGASEPPLSSFSGPVGNGVRVLGFGFSRSWKTTNVGDLVYLFVFEPEPSAPSGEFQTLSTNSSSYHDADVILQSVTFSRKDAKGNVLETHAMNLVVNRRNETFRAGELSGGPAPGRVVLVGLSPSGKLAIKRQVPAPGPIPLHVDGAKALLDGPLGRLLDLHP